ncbi:hypothetical protein BM1_03465 [Bipolaris maydis]|nr:hypothetical protein BM1_03465 [Bipolaris maydis]
MSISSLLSLSFEPPLFFYLPIVSEMETESHPRLQKVVTATWALPEIFDAGGIFRNFYANSMVHITKVH